ncbi:MAG: glutamate mutase L, partial [Thermodesulfobacteriota bacterium]|nr:glutamate mutase L [Thermodesulfobacteriota bacterium]
ALTRTAVEIAVERHAGILKEQASISGTIMVQYGKDLTGVKNLIGTGGIFRHGNYFDKIFQGALFNMNKPWYLKPRAPRFYLDSNYILYGIGLLSGVLPTKAVRIAKKYLIEFC